MTNVRIRGYQPTDEPELVAVWNASMCADPITPAVFRQNVLLDPNFDATCCFEAEVDGLVQGFLLSLGRRVPFFNQGLQPEEAWITAFGVDASSRRKGIGGQLLQAALDQMTRQGRKVVTISPYVPNYFIPGVDVAAYAAAVEFLLRHGFEVTSRPLSMRAELTGFRIPEPIAETARKLARDGVEVRPAEPSDLVLVLDFIREHFSWDWFREAGDVMERLFAGDPRQVNLLIARHAGEVVGYAQHRAERFGPFGVNPALRSRGIGRVLLAQTLLEMLKRGYHAAWFMWTSDDAARLYSQCGFHEVRRFAVMKRVLSD